MHSNHSSGAPRKAVVIFVAIVLLLSGFYAGSLPAANAQGLPTATPWPTKPLPPGFEALSGELFIAAADGYEPDDTFAEATIIDDGVAQTHSISPVNDVDYVTFTLATASAVTLETSSIDTSAPHDTVMTLYDGTETQIDQNDDKNPNTQYSYIQRCGAYELPAGIYYVKIEEYQGGEEIPTYDIAFNTHADCVPNTTVYAADAARSSFYIRPQDGDIESYSDLNASRVQVTAIDGVTPLTSALGIKLKSSAGYTSYTEFLGLPRGKAKAKYYFPLYANATTGPVASLLFFANVGKTTTRVTVKIGASTRGPYSVAPNQAMQLSFASLNGGPVIVTSANGVPIVASMAVKLKSKAGYSSFSEYGGVSVSPSTALSTRYVFPWYSNTTPSGMTSQLRIANVGAASTNVTVTIGRVVQGTYPVGAKQLKRLSFSGVDQGPITVTSSGAPIVASLGINYKGGSTYASYSETPGLAAGTLAATKFVFPWYNNSSTGPLKSQLRIVNMGNSSTTVTVRIAGVLKGTYTLVAHASKLVSYSNLSKGPVVVASSGGVPILVSLGVYMRKGTNYESYSEFIGQPGLPGSQLQPSSWFPLYNNASASSFVSQLRIGIP